MKRLRYLTLIGTLFALTGCDQLGLHIGNSILIVDLDAVAKATGKQELMQKELEIANLNLTEELELVASRLEESLEQEKNKLGISPSKYEKQQLNNQVSQATKKLANTKHLAIQKSQDYRSALILQFRKEISEISQEIARQSGGKLVLVSNYETLWFDPSTDITDEVIAVLRARKIRSISTRKVTSIKTDVVKKNIEEYPDRIIQ